MKGLIASLAVGALLFITGIAAAGASDVVDGSWTLNAAKSKFSPGPAPMNMTRTYVVDGATTTLTYSTTNADGSTSSGKAAYQTNGKDYPFSGSAMYDMLSVRRVNGSTIKSILKKDGKPVGTSVRSVSGHGKVLTLATKYTDPKGVAHADVAVFDRQ